MTETGSMRGDRSVEVRQRDGMEVIIGGVLTCLGGSDRA